MYCKLHALSLVCSSSVNVRLSLFSQWVPLLKRSGLNVFSLARLHPRVPVQPRVRVTGTRLLASHSQSLVLSRVALTLSLVAMRNVFIPQREEVPKNEPRQFMIIIIVVVIVLVGSFIIDSSYLCGVYSLNLKENILWFSARS